MDPNLHIKQAMNHLDRVLSYAPMVAEDDGTAEVHLTPEDWQVVADALFRMDTPPNVIPQPINDYSLTSQNKVIRLDTDEYVIDLKIAPTQ